MTVPGVASTQPQALRFNPLRGKGNPCSPLTLCRRSQKKWRCPIRQNKHHPIGCGCGCKTRMGNASQHDRIHGEISRPQRLLWDALEHSIMIALPFSDLEAPLINSTWPPGLLMRPSGPIVALTSPNKLTCRAVLIA